MTHIFVRAVPLEILILIFFMSHPHAAHCRVHLFAFCQSSAPGGQAVTWVPSGVGSFPMTWWLVISGRPVRAISFERRLVLQ